MFDELKKSEDEILPIGLDNADIYVLGDYPSDRDILMKKPFSGNSGEIFKTILEHLKINPEKVRYNNSVYCKVENTDSIFCKGPSDLLINSYRDRVFADIKKTKPKVIIAMDDSALKCLFNRSEPGIFGWRGWQVPHRELHCWVVPVFPMRTILKDGISDNRNQWVKGTNHTDTLRVLREDLSIVPDLLKVPLPIIEPYEIKKLLKFSEVMRLFEMAINKDFFVFDIETIGLKPYFSESCILSCAITFDGKTVYAFPISYHDYISKNKYWTWEEEGEILKKFKGLLTNKAIKVAHNSVFEMEWAKAILGIDIINIEDSMLQKYILDCREGTKGLDFLTFANYGISHKVYPSNIMSDLTQISIEDLLDYNGKDSIFEYRIYKIQEKQLNKEKILQEQYLEQLETAKTIAQIQYDGADTNEDGRNNLLIGYKNTLGNIEKELLDLDSVKKFRDRFGKVPALKSNSKDIPTILFKIEKLEAFKKTNKGNFSVDKEVLMNYSSQSKFCELLLKYREFSGLESKIIKSWTECVFPDGKYHTNFYPLETGRLGSSSPNLQNLDKRKHPEIRQIIVAPEGYVLLIFDQAQLEARVIAAVSNCRNFIDMIKNGYDIHKAKAIEIWGEEIFNNANEKDKKLMRYRAKNEFVFPTIYGAKPLATSKRLGISEARAEQLLNKLWSDFPEINEWQEKVLEIYDKKRYVEIPPGRRRYAPLTRNEILNTPIQGGAASIISKMMNILSRRKYHIMMNVHDELVFCVKEKEVKDSIKEIQSVMEYSHFDFMGDVPLVVEGSIGFDWFHTVPIKEVFI